MRNNMTTSSPHADYQDMAHPTAVPPTTATVPSSSTVPLPSSTVQDIRLMNNALPNLASTDQYYFASNINDVQNPNTISPTMSWPGPSYAEPHPLSFQYLPPYDEPPPLSAYYPDYNMISHHNIGLPMPYINEPPPQPLLFNGPSIMENYHNWDIGDDMITQAAGNSNNICGDSSCLPAGYKFFPNDDELILAYLMKKVSNQPLPSNIIVDVDLYKCNPWDLFAENQKWYFFTPRDRKYRNGNRPNRIAGDGYWKATGADHKITYNHRKPYNDKVYGDIVYGDTIGTKRSLAFYKGKAPKGDKTNWIIHEFTLDKDRCRPKRRASTMDMRLDDWVLCSIYHKGSSHHHDNIVNEPMTSDFNNNNIGHVQESASTDQYLHDHDDQHLVHHQVSSESATINGGYEVAGSVPPNNSANHIHNQHSDI